MTDCVAAVAADECNLGALDLPVGTVDALELTGARGNLQHTLDVGLR